MWQVFNWRFEAARITWLQVKSVAYGLNVAEWMEFGASCSSLGDDDCAAASFRQALKLDPDFRLGLANLSVAEAKRHNCADALVAMGRYGTLTHESAEVLYWRGKCEQEQGDFSAARNTFYSALAMGSDATMAGEALIDLLKIQGLFEEAFSVIGGLSQGRPSENPRWRRKYTELLSQSGATPSGHSLDEPGKRVLRLPALDGQKFWAPIRFSSVTPVEFANIDVDQPDSVLGGSLLTAASLTLGASRRPASGEPVVLPAWQLGPWVLKDVSFSACDCESTIGRALLDRFEVSEDVEAGIHFLVLSPL